MARTESSFGCPSLCDVPLAREQPCATVPAAHRVLQLLLAQVPKIPKQQTTPQERETWLLLWAAKVAQTHRVAFFVFHKLFSSWLWHCMRTSLANICTNFMLIKIRLLRQAWLLSHSYDYCLDLWYYKRKGKACSRRVMVVNFSREGFSLQFFSINDCCMNGLQGLLEDSVDPLGNPCHKTDAGFFPLCSSDLKNCLIFFGFSPLQKSTEIAGNFFF